VHDRGADLALDVVTDDGQPASENFLAHTGSDAMKTGMAFTKATPASRAAWA
jgi:hypothetical protein